MKQLLLFLFFISIQNLQAQVTTVISGLGQPDALQLRGENIIFADFNNNTVSQFNINDANPVPEVLFSDIDNPTGLAMDGDLLYVSQNTLNAGMVSVTDLTVNPLALESVSMADLNPLDVFFHEDALYVCEIGEGRILKIDLTDPNATPEVFLEGLNGPVFGLVDANELYVAEFYDDKISRIDLSASNPVSETVITDLDGPNHLIKIGDDLIITEFLGNKISKVNLTDPTLTLEDLVVDLEGPAQSLLVEQGDDFGLYITEYVGGKISKFEFDFTLNTAEEDDFKEDLMVYPNPSSDYIQLKNLTKTAICEIFNIHGKKVSELKVVANQQVDIRHLSAGQYTLKLNNTDSFVFIKM